MKPQDGNGTYSGYFAVDGKKTPCEAELEWSVEAAGMWRFKGSGVDAGMAEFTLAGTAELGAPCRVQITRTATGGGGGATRGEGFREKACFNMFGSCGGAFSLRKEAEGPKLRPQLRAKLFQELLSMGFEEDAVSACVESGMGRAEAIEHLTAPPPRAAAGHDAPHDNNHDALDRAGELVAMGFSRARAEEALAVTDGDMTAAIDYCMASSS